MPSPPNGPTFIFSAVRVHDAVARLGGDEFGVLAVDVSTALPGRRVEAVGWRVEECLAEAEIAASVGAALLDGEAGASTGGRPAVSQ